MEVPERVIEKIIYRDVGVTEYVSGNTVYVTTGGQNMDYTSLGFIFAVMVICIVTVKLVIPRLTLKNVMLGFCKLVFWPVKKAWAAVDKDWEEVKKGE